MLLTKRVSLEVGYRDTLNLKCPPYLKEKLEGRLAEVESAEVNLAEAGHAPPVVLPLLALLEFNVSINVKTSTPPPPNNSPKTSLWGIL